MPKRKLIKDPLSVVKEATVEPAKKEYVKTVCLNFDGVIHEGISSIDNLSIIADEPVDGAFKFIDNCLKGNFKVIILTERAVDDDAIKAMKQWLIAKGCEDPEMLAFTHLKPKADMYLDERGHLFYGQFPSVQYIMNFQTWNKKWGKR